MQTAAYLIVGSQWPNCAGVNSPRDTRDSSVPRWPITGKAECEPSLLDAVPYNAVERNAAGSNAAESNAAVSMMLHRAMHQRAMFSPLYTNTNNCLVFSQTYKFQKFRISQIISKRLFCSAPLNKSCWAFAVSCSEIKHNIRQRT